MRSHLRHGDDCLQDEVSRLVFPNEVYEPAAQADIFPPCKEQRATSIHVRKKVETNCKYTCTSETLSMVWEGKVTFMRWVRVDSPVDNNRSGMSHP